MSAHPTEREASFACPSRAVGDVLYIHRLAELMRVEDQQMRLTDTYLDTSDLALHGLGCVLRIREDALGTRLATFKGPPMLNDNSENSVQQRIEVESDIGEVDPPLDRSRPLALYDQIPAFAEAQANIGEVLIQPVAQIVNNRRIMVFRSTQGLRVEVAIDRVSGVRMRDYYRLEFLEVEIELVTGDNEAFDRIVADLRTQAPELRPDSRSKLARVIDAT